MIKNKLTDAEKKEIIKNILGVNHHAIGKNYPIFSEMMNGLGTFNDALSFAELLPVLNTWISGSVASSVVSTASFFGVILFPFQQMINLINANEIGLRSYSYRAISYTITAWAFNKQIPISSPQVLINITSGPIVSTKTANEYNKIWRETSVNVAQKLEQVCLQKRINKKHIKAVFKALGQGKPEVLSILILKGFEKEFSPVSRHIWKSNYSIKFPR
jgi:hypothetical protein